MISFHLFNTNYIFILISSLVSLLPDLFLEDDEEEGLQNKILFTFFYFGI